MSRCRSGTCRLLSDSCQPFGPFAYRCFAVAVGLYIHRRANTDVSRKIGGLTSCIQKEPREGWSFNSTFCSASERDTTSPFSHVPRLMLLIMPPFATRLARQWLSRRRTPFGSNWLPAHGPEAGSFDDAPVSLSHMTIVAPRFRREVSSLVGVHLFACVLFWQCLATPRSAANSLCKVTSFRVTSSDSNRSFRGCSFVPQTGAWKSRRLLRRTSNR